MAGISIDIKGAEALERKMAAYAATVPRRMLGALTEAAIIVEADAKRLAPVDTGRLRASIVHRANATPTGAEAFVETNVEYAIYQEFGTSRMAAQPFMLPALEGNRGRIKGLIDAALDIKGGNNG